MIHRAFISPNELYEGRIVTYAEVADIAAQMNRSEALHFLGFLNLLLSSATTESKLNGDIAPVRDVQHWVLREIVSERLLADLKAKFRDASLLDRPILHRTQILFAIRLVATHGQVSGGNMLGARPDFDPIGDLLFLINGLFSVDETHPLTRSKALVVATSAGPMYELENPPPIELTLPRVQDLLIDRLPLASGDPAELERLEQVTVFTSGLNIRAWLDLSFMLFSFWSTATFRELMANRRRGYLDPSQPHEVISEPMLRRAIEGLGIAFQDVPQALRLDGYSRQALYDLTPFRTKPLWVMPDGSALCIDAGLLTERLGPHVFWSVINALDTKERRHRFSGAWGRAFEEYVLDALNSVFRGKKWAFHPNPIDESLNEELWDGLAVRETAVIAIEIKGTFMQTAAKYSGTPWRFARGLSEKFGMAPHAGAFQLARGISRVWFDRRAQTPLLKPERTTDVFPLLVVQDPVLEFGGVSRVVSDRFLRRISLAQARLNHKTPKIWPLTVVMANDLDRLTAAVEATGVRLDAVLKRFHRTFPSRARALSELFDTAQAKDFGFPDKVRKIIGDRFAMRMQGMMERFRSAEYGGVGRNGEGNPPPH